jgi:hypothetical protein
VRDWASAARLVLLKARHDFLTGGRSPALRSLLDEVMEASSQARIWWNDPEIVRIRDTKIELYDPAEGWITTISASSRTRNNLPFVLWSIVFDLSQGSSLPRF